MNFNHEQLSAVRHFKGPCMVLAGPGSGKTTVIVNRIRYLTERFGVPPEKILVITFTRAAAEEMRERYRILTGGEQGISFGTFHALFFKILRYAYHYDFSSILTEPERYRFIKDAAKKAGIESISEIDLIPMISNDISTVKNSGLDAGRFMPSSFDSKTFKTVFDEFERILRTEGKIDFDDMLLMCRRLFDEREDILGYWQEVYDHILIDEFQDICPLQYELIMRLAQKHGNVFVVGDDDQSIYSFRGADPGMLAAFEKDHKKCRGYEKIFLSVNYRCQKQIVEAASMLIRNNKKRFGKDLRSGRLSIPRTSTVLFREFGELRQETLYVANMIEELKKRGVDQSEIAVLYRVNTQPGPLITTLKDKNIKFTLRDTVPNIYDHWIARNILAYIELAQLNFSQKESPAGRMGKADTEDGEKVCERFRSLFVSIANRPVRYITREAMRKPGLNLESLIKEFSDRQYIRERVEKLRYDLYVISRMNMFAAVKYIRKAVGYDDFLKKFADERQIDGEGLFDILDEIEAAAREFESLDEWKRHIEEYSEALRERKNQDKEKESGVSLLTFHGAKGMEFDTVFIIDASEDYVPYYKAGNSKEVEEERRMFYVAMTRAKNRLFILHASERLGRKKERSRFLKESGIL